MHGKVFVLSATQYITCLWPFYHGVLQISLHGSNGLSDVQHTPSKKCVESDGPHLHEVTRPYQQRNQFVDCSQSSGYSSADVTVISTTCSKESELLLPHNHSPYTQDSWASLSPSEGSVVHKTYYVYNNCKVYQSSPDTQQPEMATGDDTLSYHEQVCEQLYIYGSLVNDSLFVQCGKLSLISGCYLTLSCQVQV